MLASVAQFETEIRRERTAAGIAAAKAKGKRWGGSKKGNVSRNTASLEQRATIKALRAQDMAITKIAKSVGVSRQTVYKHLKTP